MILTCDDRERVFMDGTSEEWGALVAHASWCAACSEEIRAWKSLSVAAAELQKEWDSPALWPRIGQALTQQSARTVGSWWRRAFLSWNLASFPWQAVAAAVVLVALTGTAIWFVTNRQRHEVLGDQALLDDKTVNEVKRAEAAYEQAIDKLDLQARPALENSATPLIANYREKLLVLDSAISDLKSQTGMNPANGHLRRQLLAMYREKQDTLEQILEEKK
jgi:hypothetical protein